MSEPSSWNPAHRDARRPGLRNRVRRLVHPHRRTAIRTIVGMLIAVAVLATVGGAIRSLRADGRSPVQPGGVDELRPDWVADLGSGPVTGIAVEDEAIFVSTERAVLRLDVPCEPVEPCAPTWRGDVADGPLSAPAVFDQRVFAGSSDGRLYAFPADCSLPCEPEWVGQAGDDRVSQPAVNDDLVYVTSDRLYAFPSRCGTGDRVCSPVWSAAIPGRPSPGPPALGGGLVVVTSSAAGGSVYAFPAVCSGRCEPVWAAATSGQPGAVTLQEDIVYVAAGGRLLAFSLACQSTCNPDWSGTFTDTSTVGPGAADPPFAQGDLVYVGADDGTVWAFPSSCPDPSCEAVRSFDLSASNLWRPVVQGNLLYVTSTEGTLHAVVEGCDPADTTCQRPRSSELDAPTRAGAAAGEDAVYAGDDAGRLYAFSRPTTP